MRPSPAAAVYDDAGVARSLDVWINRVYDDHGRTAAILVAARDGTAVARLREEIVRLGEQHVTASEGRSR